jgi:hypothetical protein
MDVAVGESVSGGVGAGNPGGVFQFEAPPGQPLFVEVVPDDSLDPVLNVRRPDGLYQYADADGTGGVESVVVDGSVAGQSLVIVTGYGSTTGRYELSIRPADVMDVAIGDSVSGAIEASNRSSVFQFEVPPGQPLVVEVVPDDSLDPVLDVRSPGGLDQYADAGGTGGVESVVIDGSVAGQSLVIVTGYGSTTGDYELSIRPADVMDVAVGESVSGGIGAGNPGGVYQFEAPPGQPLVVEVEPDGSLDPVLNVRPPDGLYEYADAGGSGASEEVAVDNPVAGRYLVVVTGSGSTTGEYQLSLQSSNANRSVGRRG